MMIRFADLHSGAAAAPGFIVPSACAANSSTSLPLTAAAHRSVHVLRQVLRQVAAAGIVHDDTKVIIGQVRLPHGNDVRVPLQPRVVHQLPA